MTTGKTIALTRWAFVGKVMSLVFNMLSRLAIIREMQIKTTMRYHLMQRVESLEKILMWEGLGVG